MSPNTETWISKNLPPKYRKRALQIFDDPLIDHHVVDDEKLKELFVMGQHSRDDEVARMRIESAAMEQAFACIAINIPPRTTLPWWIGALGFGIAVAHFYFTYLFR